MKNKQQLFKLNSKINHFLLEKNTKNIKLNFSY
jgi:hypothetical protein